MALFGNKSATDGDDTGVKDQKHSNHILILVGILGLIVAYLTLRKLAAGNSTSAAPLTTTAQNGASDPNQASWENTQFAGLQQQITDLTNQETTDVTSLGNTQAQDENTNASLFSTIADKLSSIGQQASQASQVTASLPQNNFQNEIQSLPANVIDAMRADGEYIVSSTQSTEPGGGGLFLTNKGGVYTTGPAQFFGSYIGYANTTANPKAETSAHGDFSHGTITAKANGGYTLTNSNGETYSFDQSTAGKY